MYLCAIEIQPPALHFSWLQSMRHGRNLSREKQLYQISYSIHNSQLTIQNFLVESRQSLVVSRKTVFI